MEKVVFRNLGRASNKMKIGPGRGMDNAIVSLGAGRVMILTVDPVSAVPAFGMKLSAWLSVHLIASDYTTSGAEPELATFSYNFPETMTQTEREEYVRSVSDECKKIGVSIAGGHVGSYPGGGFTVIGAGSMFGFASEGEYVAPSMARAGDAILMTKHAAIEAVASLAVSFPRFTESRVGHALVTEAKAMIRLCTTVKDALAARRIGLGGGGVTSMHDATEGGVLGALDEMASASKKAFLIDASTIPVTTQARAVCAAFGLDPLRTLGEGALVITCSPARVPEIERAMGCEGVPVRKIGEVKEGNGLRLRHTQTTKKFLPGPDRYWAAYDRAVRRKLK